MTWIELAAAEPQPRVLMMIVPLVMTLVFGCGIWAIWHRRQGQQLWQRIGTTALFGVMALTGLSMGFVVLFGGSLPAWIMIAGMVLALLAGAVAAMMAWDARRRARAEAIALAQPPAPPHLGMWGSIFVWALLTSLVGTAVVPWWWIVRQEFSPVAIAVCVIVAALLVAALHVRHALLRREHAQLTAAIEAAIAAARRGDG